jgi:AcrR family transcriptional regulator
VTADAESQPVRPGRRRDHTRDPEILDAALDVLAEHGFVGMTVDMVATRARAGKATVYRRWPTKVDLVLDALGRLNQDWPSSDLLADTGTLRGDLDALLASGSAEDGQRRLGVMAGLTSMLTDHEDAAERATVEVVEPWVEINRVLLRRAITRGEIPSSIDVEELAWVIPSMATYRACIQRRPIEPDWIRSLVDGVLLPAVGLART